VAESWSLGNRVFVEDSRSNGTFLRVTWHPDGQQFVVSHWRDDGCVAATRVPVDAAPDLIGVLVRGLSDAAQHGETPMASPEPRRRGWRDVVARVLRRQVPPEPVETPAPLPAPRRSA
jgi:hypothetical protein